MLRLAMLVARLAASGEVGDAADDTVKTWRATLRLAMLMARRVALRFVLRITLRAARLAA